MNNFWRKLDKPILALAPMYNVTDVAFRQMLVELGKPDVVYTEFVSADGLANEKSREKLIKLHLTYKKNERPIVAQIFGANPETIYQASKIIEDLGFDGVDINMGCPDKKVVKSGQGAALIKNPKSAIEIINSAKEGAKNIPISVKTRIGFNSENVEDGVNKISSAKPEVIIMHGRTKKEMSEVPANWGLISRGAKIAHENGILYLGNGDVKSKEEAIEKSEKYDLDGVMIGRGLFENLELFSGHNFSEISIKNRAKLMVRHAKLFEKNFLGLKPFDVFKKHIRNYIFGFNGAKDFRSLLMKAKNSKELKKICKGFK